jgi:hypothetical protein
LIGSLFVDVVPSSLDLIVWSVAVVNEQTKQGNIADKVIFSTIEVTFLLFDSVAELSVRFSFAFAARTAFRQSPLEASRSAIKQFGKYVVVGFTDQAGSGTNVRGVRNFPRDADQFGHRALE